MALKRHICHLVIIRHQRLQEIENPIIPDNPMHKNNSAFHILTSCYTEKLPLLGGREESRPYCINYQ